VGDHPLVEIDLKLRRADEEFAVLDEAVVALTSRVHSFVGEMDQQTTEMVFRVDEEPPPLSWGIHVSLIAHLWRSVLDNLFWAIIVARDKRPRGKASFPICLTPEAFKAHRRKPEYKGPRPEDWALIEEAQPFKAGTPWNLRDPSSC
jgi:hypothetical protein